MPDLPPPRPGHNAQVSRQPVITDGKISYKGADKWLAICTACGDSLVMDYESIPPDARQFRGPYDDRWEAQAWADWHNGGLTALVHEYVLDDMDG